MDSLKEKPPLKDRFEAWFLFVMGMFALVGFVSLGDAIQHWRGKVPTCERITGAREWAKSLKSDLEEADVEIIHAQMADADREILRKQVKKIETELANLDSQLQQCNCPE